MSTQKKLENNHSLIALCFCKLRLFMLLIQNAKPNVAQVGTPSFKPSPLFSVFIVNNKFFKSSRNAAANHFDIRYTKHRKNENNVINTIFHCSMQKSAKCFIFSFVIIE